MSGCASVRPLPLPADLYACPAPQPYPEIPDTVTLIEALNDTYLVWEECRDNLARLEALNPAQL